MSRKKAKAKKVKLQKMDKQMNVFSKVKGEHSFILVNGESINSLLELVDKLGYIDDSVFKSHVNFEKNDFRNWIKDVYKDSSLAEEVASCWDKKDMQIAILKKMAFENRK